MDLPSLPDSLRAIAGACTISRQDDGQSPCAVYSIREDLGEGHLSLFFELLGEEPDLGKIGYFLLLDELF